MSAIIKAMTQNVVNIKQCQEPILHKVVIDFFVALIWPDIMFATCLIGNS